MEAAAEMSEQEEFEFRLRYEQEHGQAQKPRPQAPRGGVTLAPSNQNQSAAQRWSAGLGETALALGSGAIAAPVAGLMGLAGSAYGGADTGAQWVRQTQQDMTYAPRTPEGEALTGVVQTPFMALSELGNWGGQKVSDLTGSPAAGAATATGINFLPAVFGRTPASAAPVAQGGGMIRSARGRQPPQPIPGVGVPNPNIPLSSIRQPQNAQRLDTFNEANRAGYQFAPSQIEPSWWRSDVIESIGGKAAIKQDATLHNQEITNQLARQALGIGKYDRITLNRLNALRDRWAQPYREVAELDATPTGMTVGAGGPVSVTRRTAAEQLDDLKNARFDAREAWQAARDTGDPKALAAARNAEASVAQLENMFEEKARAAGKPQLVQQLRNARREIAKTYDVELALNYADGDVNARVLGKLWDATGGNRFSGPLLTIAKTAEAFPQFVGPRAGNPTGGVSQLKAAQAAWGLAEVAGGNPGGWLQTIAPFITDRARARALGPSMQRPLSNEASVSLRDLSALLPSAGIDLHSLLPAGAAPGLGLRPPERE